MLILPFGEVLLIDILEVLDDIWGGTTGAVRGRSWWGRGTKAKICRDFGPEIFFVDLERGMSS